MGCGARGSDIKRIVAPVGRKSLKFEHIKQQAFICCNDKKLAESHDPAWVPARNGIEEMLVAVEEEEEDDAMDVEDLAEGGSAAAS